MQDNLIRILLFYYLHFLFNNILQVLIVSIVPTITEQDQIVNFSDTWTVSEPGKCAV